MSPKIVDREVKRQKIVQAAIDVFVQKGITDTKIADIAVAAGMGKGTIYEYFKNKDDIFLEAFNLYRQGIGTEIQQIVAPLKDPKEKLFAFTELAFKSFLQSQDMADVMFDFWVEGIRCHQEKINLKASYEIYQEWVISFLVEGVQMGVFTKMDTRLVASIILGTMDGLLIQWFVYKGDFPLLDAGKSFIETILKGILTGNDPRE